MRKRTLLQWLVLVVAFWSVLFKPISSLPGLAAYLKYAPDGILFLMLMLTFKKSKASVKRDIYSLYKIVICFLVYCLFVYLIQYQSAAYLLWGFRNNFRFYIAFFAFINYLDTDDAASWVRVMDVLFWMNATLSFFQFFVLGIGGDFLGGIFGVQGASNAFTLCLISIVVCKTMLEAFNGQESLKKCFIKACVSIIVAAMAELKFYFFVFAFILVFSALITRFSIKKVFMMFVAIIIVMIGAMLLVTWFGFGDFLSLEGLFEQATKENYSSQGDVNRLTSIPTLIKRLEIDTLQQLFGMGLGNCDTSAFAVCNTPFYRNYGYLHYTWFTAAMMFLETGYIGLAIYISFFIACFNKAYRKFKSKTGTLLYNQQTMILSVLCLILTVYNSSLRIESAYMMYFVLALPFIPEAPKETPSEMIATQEV